MPRLARLPALTAEAEPPEGTGGPLHGAAIDATLNLDDAALAYHWLAKLFSPLQAAAQTRSGAGRADACHAKLQIWESKSVVGAHGARILR